MTFLLLFSKDSQIFLYIGVFILYAFIFVFWLFMLIDAIRNRNTQGTIWIIIIALAGFIGSLVYYFIVRRKRKRKQTTGEPVPQDSGAYYLGGTTKDDVIKY